MRKIEFIWRALLADPSHLIRQQALAERFQMAPSTVHAALRLPRQIGAVSVGRSGIRILDQRKLLTIWSVYRNLKQDVLARLWIDAPASEIEGDMVAEACFSGPSACKLYFDVVPADYDLVLVYLAARDLPTLARRFEGRSLSQRRALQRRPPNLIVLKPDPYLGPRISAWQVLADLFQLPNWWATDFSQRLEERVMADAGLLS